MADLGAELTDEIIRKLNNRLEKIYTEAYKKAVSNNQRTLNRLDKLAGQLQEAKDEGYIEIIKPLEQKHIALSTEILRRTKIKENIAKGIADAGQLASKIINGEMLNIYGLNLEYTNYIIDKQAALMLDWNIYDRNQLKVILADNQTPYAKIAYKNLGKDKQIVQRLGNELAIAIINGENQKKIINRIKKITGQSISQAKRVAQTERTRVQSQARNQGIDEAVGMGVEMDKQWVARMVRTRDSHADQHLEIVTAGETFSNGLLYPGDPNGSAEEVINCFCIEVPMVRKVPESIRKYREEMKIKTFETYRKYRGVG